MNFKKLEDTNIAYKGKCVRFKGTIPARIKTILGPDFVVHPQNVGICYEVRGITLFVGFNDPKNGTPNKSDLTSGRVDKLNHHIQIYARDDKRWEVEI